MQDKQFTYSFITKEYTCHHCGGAQKIVAQDIKSLQKMCQYFERKHKTCVPEQETTRANAWLTVR
jgi:hypothetical protein